MCIRDRSKAVSVKGENLGFFFHETFNDFNDATDVIKEQKLEYLNQMCIRDRPLTERAPYTLTFGKICSPKRKINNTLFQKTSEIPQEKSETLQKKESIIPSAEEVIDEVLISLFRAPHSYTGEDSTEIKMCIRDRTQDDWQEPEDNIQKKQLPN